MEINKSIQELLFKHNCVVVPNFGGFVASISPAQINIIKGLILPPRKIVLFNKHLINNDGLLIHHLSAKNNINYQETSLLLNDEIKEWNNLLFEGHPIIIEHVGKIFLDQEQNIQFEQERFFNLLNESFGLGKVSFIPAENLKEIEVPRLDERQDTIKIDFVSNTQPVESKVSNSVKIEIGKDSKVIPLRKTTIISRKLVKYVTAACLIPIAFYSVWIPVNTDVLESGVLFSSDFNPFIKEKNSNYQSRDFNFKFEKYSQELSIVEEIEKLPKDVEIFAYEFATDLYIPVFLPNKEDKLLDVKIDSKHDVSGNENIGHIYYKVIAGSFSLEENANSLVIELKNKGFEAFIVQDAQKFRVCAANCSSAQKASEVVKELRISSIEAWVLK